MTTQPDQPPEPGDPAYRATRRAELLREVPAARVPLGFGYLTDEGTVETSRPVELWITCRMTHVAALGAMAGEPAAVGGPNVDTLLELAAHGLAALAGPLRDHAYGGWHPAVGDQGPVRTSKEAYGHAFVVLAASSAAAARVPGADELLADALDVLARRFWDDDDGLVVEEWDRGWTALAEYRGVNANMHTVEALLAAGDVTGDRSWHARAARVAARVADWSAGNGWRVPEHFDPSWEPLLEHHRDRPADPFRPYGATVGHGLEWARLLLAVDASLDEPPPGLLRAAVALYDRAVADGWAADGADGFVYTTDWDGRPVVRHRMHWVVCEAAAAATALGRVTGHARYDDDARRWWTYVDRYVLDRTAGTWRHELDELNRPSAEVWPGRPDVYHAYQAALLPDLPLTPSFAAALRDGTVPSGGRTT